MKDLVIREGLYYKKFTESPFSGKISGLQNGGFKNGKLTGGWVTYHKNGQLKTKGAYLEGIKVEFWVGFDQGGTKILEGNYTNGPFWSKKENGQYKDGFRDGLWKTTSVSNSIICNLSAKNNVGQSVLNYKKGLKHGLFTVYHANNNLLAKGMYINGSRDGIWAIFNEDGSIENWALYSDNIVKVKNWSKYNKNLSNQKESFFSTSCR